MKPIYKVFGSQDGKMHDRIAQTRSKTWAFAVAFWHFPCYNEVFVTSTLGRYWEVRNLARSLKR